MRKGEFLDIAIKVLGGAVGVLVAALLIGGMVGQALAYSAALAAIAGTIFLLLGLLKRG